MGAYRADAARQRARSRCQPAGELIAIVECVRIPDDADACKGRILAEDVSIDAGALRTSPASAFERPGKRGRASFR